MLGFVLLAACGDDANLPPIARPVDVQTLEETPVAGHLDAVDPEGLPLRYVIGNAEHGHVTSMTSDGGFTFEPDPDYFGTAAFAYVAVDVHAKESVARVTITVENVNDPPRLMAVPDLHNSPETETIEYQLVVIDPDSDEHAFTISVARPDIAEVTVDEPRDLLLIKPLGIGATRVDVVVADGELSDSTVFEFAVDEVIKEQIIEMAPSDASAITITNQTTDSVDFALEHNGFQVFENAEDVVAHVEALPAEFPEEPFERKLWRFLLDATRHYKPLMPQQFAQAPWATLNSLGFGFCADVATTYVALARAAGYEARVWSIGGHVVPEIRTSGRWQVYDPDLAVYYLDRNGQVAGVEQLAADPDLVANPIGAILPMDSWPYSTVVADIYGTQSNNVVGDYVLLPSVPEMLGRFHLPAGASLTYPGRWTETPIAHEVFGVRIMDDAALNNWRAVAEQHGLTDTYPIPFHKQAKIDLPTGWTGEVALPLWLWDVQGTGSVAIDEITYSIGSEALRERLRYRMAPRSIRILSGTDVQLVMQINFVQFGLEAANEVRVRGLNVWGLAVEKTTVSEHYAGEIWPYSRGEP